MKQVKQRKTNTIISLYVESQTNKKQKQIQEHRELVNDKGKENGGMGKISEED